MTVDQVWLMLTVGFTAASMVLLLGIKAALKKVLEYSTLINRRLFAMQATGQLIKILVTALVAAQQADSQDQSARRQAEQALSDLKKQGEIDSETEAMLSQALGNALASDPPANPAPVSTGTGNLDAAGNPPETNNAFNPPPSNNAPDVTQKADVETQDSEPAKEAPQINENAPDVPVQPQKAAKTSQR